MSDAPEPEPPPAKPKRRFFPRFTLRSLTLCVLLTASAFGLWWRWEPWHLLDEVQLEERPFAVTFSPDGKSLAASPSGSKVVAFQVGAFGLKKAFSHENKDVGWISYAANGESIVAYSGVPLKAWEPGPVLRVLDAKDGRLILENPIMGQYEVSPDRESLLIAVPTPEELRKDSSDRLNTPEHWKLVDPASGQQRAAFDSEGFWSSRVAFGPTGKLLAYTDKHGVLKAWNARNGQLVLSLQANDEAVASLSVAIDDRFIATSGRDGFVRVWSAESGTKVAERKFEPEVFLGVHFGPDAKQLLIEEPNTAWSWAWPEDKATQLALPEDSNDLSHFSPSRKKLVIDGDTTSVMDTETLRVLFTFNKGMNVAGDIFEFSKDESLLLSKCEKDFEFKVRDANSGTVLFEVLDDRYAEILLSPNDRRLFSIETYSHLPVRIYDADAASKPLFEIPTPAADLSGAYALSDDGSLLALAAQDSSLTVWQRRRPEWWWGVAWLPEFWLTVVFALLLGWSLVRDFKTLRKAKATA